MKCMKQISDTENDQPTSCYRRCQCPAWRSQMVQQVAGSPLSNILNHNLLLMASTSAYGSALDRIAPCMAASAFSVLMWPVICVIVHLSLKHGMRRLQQKASFSLTEKSFPSESAAGSQIAAIQVIYFSNIWTDTQRLNASVCSAVPCVISCLTLILGMFEVCWARLWHGVGSCLTCRVSVSSKQKPQLWRSTTRLTITFCAL